ncbi:hypothetical protein CHARACLAT_018430 [Characodon lateralis]|uniref:Uncharacterized protein n=1 Tax=Characodon lateralis TaxID=208331 RepID=A0ABU7EEY4_9TELE|nr:hypothetical protein [Characodon lateralis]
MPQLWAEPHSFSTVMMSDMMSEPIRAGAEARNSSPVEATCSSPEETPLYPHSDGQSSSKPLVLLTEQFRKKPHRAETCFYATCSSLFSLGLSPKGGSKLSEDGQRPVRRHRSNNSRLS